LESSPVTIWSFCAISLAQGTDAHRVCSLPCPRVLLRPSSVSRPASWPSGRCGLAARWPGLTWSSVAYPRGSWVHPSAS
jgi:hypothetical protein